MAAGAHGLLVEVVQDGADRGELLSDGEQGIPREVLEEIMDEVKQTRVPMPGAVPTS
jgi:3-deoxy-D-arabino-heptulosonate 7-phosphate (DAHP) synthase